MYRMAAIALLTGPRDGLDRDKYTILLDKAVLLKWSLSESVRCTTFNPSYFLWHQFPGCVGQSSRSDHHSGYCVFTSCRCIKLALVHDMAESIVGDLTPHDGISKEEKHNRETVSHPSWYSGVQQWWGGHTWSAWAKQVAHGGHVYKAAEVMTWLIFLGWNIVSCRKPWNTYKASWKRSMERSCLACGRYLPCGLLHKTIWDRPVG